MLLGFALTRHCNLRCPHCIRDDVTSVHALPAALLARTLDEALALWPEVTASFTGGEPTLHPDWAGILDAVRERAVPYRFVTNGWHMRRVLPSLDRWPPQGVRVSLSGASEATHDAERGRGSFRRVLLAIALLTSRRIPASLSIVIDRRDRHEVRAAADLAESLGCTRLHYILPQPVPASVSRGSDLAAEELWAARREIAAIAAEPGRRTMVQLDWGYPVDEEEERAADGTPSCDTFALRRLYLDVEGRVSLCCQLSEYGGGEADVVGDLATEPLVAVWDRYQRRLAELERAATRGREDDPLAALPCLRCARALGKLAWLDGLAVTATG